MPQDPMATEALENPQAFYDARYEEGYMEGFSDLYEMCRVQTIQDVFRKLNTKGLLSSPQNVLDYGCGQGRYMEVVRNSFPHAKVSGCDISEVGLKIAGKHQPGAELVLMQDERVSLPDASFDMIISIEVLEHVRNAEASAHEISRLLKPNGVMILTTPCANKYSLEWLYNKLRNGLQPSADGYGRFSTDEPGHLRRLTDKHLISLFAQQGVDVIKIYHSAHLFTTLSMAMKSRLPGISNRVKVEKMAMLDWHLFKYLSNGATMVAVGIKH